MGERAGHGNVIGFAQNPPQLETLRTLARLLSATRRPAAALSSSGLKVISEACSTAAMRRANALARSDSSLSSFAWRKESSARRSILSSAVLAKLPAARGAAHALAAGKRGVGAAHRRLAAQLLAW